MSAIFQTTSQALHFSFMIQAYEVGVESAMSRVLKHLLLNCGLGRELGGNAGASTGSSVDFGGLSPMEVRAQCAMIRAAVKDRLPGPEAWAIQARYGVTDVVNEAGERRFVLSRERSDAVIALADWLAPNYELPREALDLLVLRHFSERALQRVSFRALAEKFGGSHMLYARAFGRLRERLHELECLGIDRLTPSFVEHGLVEA